MRFGKRQVVLTILIVVLVGANAWGGLLLWTLDSPVVSVKLDAACPDPTIRITTPSCTGSWTNPDGSQGSGRVGGTEVEQHGQTVDAYIGPIGAWSADDVSWLVWLVLPAAVDIGAAFAAVRIAAMKRRARADAARIMAQAPPGSRIYRLEGTAVIDTDGRPFMSMARHSDGDVSLNTPQGLPWYRVSPGGADDVLVYRKERTPAGRVSVHRQGMSPYIHFGVWNGLGRQLGWVLMSGTGTAQRDVTDAAGAVIATYVIQGKNRAVLLVPPHTETDLVATLLGAIATAHWLTLRVVARHLG